mmetsp:Transcript_44808/g.90514  ORF Transcript_44808/g.90514 Transcript_44808/m.90514 type:complete len:347 (-) Transcript_44808:454-1494(-)
MASAWGLFLIMIQLLPKITATKTVSGYCSNNECNAAVLGKDEAFVNQVSATSYHLNETGSIVRCSANYSACTWDGDVGAYNKRAPLVTDDAVRAVPLVFNNAGTTVAWFRAMVADPLKQLEAVSLLAEDATALGLAGVALDLEPSCWAANPADCTWPSSQDAAAYRSFVNALADALHVQDKTLTVAAGAWPETQCVGGEGEWRAFCEGQEKEYLYSCGGGGGARVYNTSTCNCCAFTTWFELDSLCSSGADVIVNMDTYMDAPFSPHLFVRAMNYYKGHECMLGKGTGRVAVGLLVGEASANETALLFDTIANYGGIDELDIWSNLWQSDEVLLRWSPHLKAFILG